MSSQGPSRRGTAEDRWWDEMYAGPAATSPDTGGHAPTPGTVDDWYETATRVIGGPPPEASVDEWFATASAVIGGAEAPGGGASGGGQALPGSVDDWFDTAARAITDPLGLDPVEPVDPVDLVESFDLPPRPAPPVDLTKPEPLEPAEPQPAEPAVPAPRAAEAEPRGGPVVDPVAEGWGVLPYVGGRPPTYEAEPTALPAAEPERLTEVVADTVVEGARYGALTLRAASVRGDSARFRGEPRRDHLLVSRFGTGREALLLVTVTSPPRPVAASAEPAPPGEAARRLAAAVGRSRTALVEDLREGATAADRLRYGLRRFVDAAVRHLPAAAPQALRAAALHALLIPLDPDARLRVAFGTGPGGLLLLRDGGWRDGYPPVPAPGADEGDAAFRFRAIVPEPGDVLLLAGVGLCEPLLAEPAAAAYLAEQWGRRPPPGTVEFLRQTQVRVKGHAEDRSAVALWES